MSDVLALLPPWPEPVVPADGVLAVGAWPVQQQQELQQKANHNKRKHPDEQPRSAAHAPEDSGEAAAAEGPRGTSLAFQQQQQLEQQQERKKQRHHVDLACYPFLLQHLFQLIVQQVTPERGNIIKGVASSRSLSGTGSGANCGTVNTTQAAAVVVPPAAGATAQPPVMSFAKVVIGTGTAAAANAGTGTTASATAVTNESATAATGVCVVLESDGPSVVGYTVAEGKEVLHTPSLPARPGKQTCAWYLKTGHCKYGPTCIFNHPSEYAVQLTEQGLSFRAGQPMCTFYKKTQNCKFGPSCKFHHPKLVPIYAGSAVQQQG